MRFIGILFVLLSIPAWIALLRAYPAYRHWAYFMLGLLPLTLSAINLDAAIISWAGWTGYVQGLILSILDTLAFGIIFTSRKPYSRLPFVGLFIAYIFTVTMTLLWSDLRVSSLFYVFQLLKVFLLFVAVATFSGNLRSLRWMAWGLAAGAIFQCAMAIDQKFSGVVQASGTLGHQNLLGLMLHFVTLPLLALLLGGEKSKLVSCGVLASLVAVALGASRGAIAFICVGLAILFVFSLLRSTTSRKWKVLALGGLAALIVAPLAIGSLDARFGGRAVSVELDSERAAFERAARTMWSEHPLGVGANQYVVVANTEGYSARAGVIWNWTSRSAKVHNMYLLAGAETGWLGFLALVSLIFWAIAKGILFSFKDRRDPRGDIVLGATVAIIVMSLHGLYEWVFFLVYGQYMFAIALGIIAGNVRRVKMEIAFKKYKESISKVSQYIEKPNSI